MFRRPIIIQRSEAVPYCREIIEKRAPTDESVRLLKEFEEAADKRRIETLHLKDNRFSGTIFLEHIAFDGKDAACAVFDINGHRMTVKATLDRLGNRVELLTELRDKMAQRIASEVLVAVVPRELK